MRRFIPLCLLLMLIGSGCRPASLDALTTAPPTRASLNPPATVASPSPTVMQTSTWTPAPATVQPFPTATVSAATASVPTTATMVAAAQATMDALVMPTAEGTPNTYNLIDAALARGEIDYDHATVFRFFALFESPQLPARYRSDVPIQADGLGLFAYSGKDLNRTSVATQKFVAGYVTPREVTLTPPNAHPAPTPDSSAFPFGVYEMTMEQSTTGGTLPLQGRWRLDFTDHARATLTLNGKLVITRAYSVNGNQIAFTDEFGSYACDDGDTPATYLWSLQGTALVLKKKSDSCDFRVKLLEAHSWTRG